MKRTRRHSNTKGTRQVKRGKTHDQVKRVAKKLKAPYRPAWKDAEDFVDFLLSRN